MLELLPPNLHRHLLHVGTVKEIRSGEAVEVRSGYVIVLDGEVWVFDINGDLLLGYLRKGEFLVVESFPIKLVGQRGRALLVSASDFRLVVERSPELMWRVVNSALDWARKVTELAVRLAKLKARARIAAAILDFGEQLPSISLIAKRAGVTREAASRVINRWIRTRILGRDKGKLVILEPERLRQILRSNYSSPP
jgi:CRP-like cAMP-binding protein